MKKMVLILALCFAGWGAMANTGGEKISKVEDLGKGLQKITWYYDNGRVAEEGFYMNDKKTGTWTSFDELGHKTAVVNWNRDKKDGDWYILHENGKVKYHIVYSNNKKVTATEWDENGTLLAGNQQ